MRQVPGYSLWLGHVGDVRDLHGIHAAGIRAVVDLALNEPPATVSRELVYCRFPLIDGPGNPRWLLRLAVETVAGLLRGDTPTLVYCGAGLSRSPCIAAAAIAQVRGCPIAAALAIALQSAAADVSPGLWAEVQEIVETHDSRLRDNRMGRRLDVEDADQGHGDLAAETDVDIVQRPACS
jgi:hypothetical protein